MDWTKKLEEKYKNDEMAQGLIQEYRDDLKMSDEEIYSFLESFY